MSNKIRKASHGSPDHPLTIGDIQIPCYVLEDGTRVVVQRGLQKGIGLSTSGGTGGPLRMARFVGTLAKNEEADQKLLAHFAALEHKLRTPIVFYPKGSGREAYGYEATVLADICEAVLLAKDNGFLTSKQQHIAEKCGTLIRGFARIGIIALIDEATGYQEVRDRRALQEILRKYISADMLAYQTIFPDDFYKEMFRLLGWQWRGMSVPKPSYVGKLTNDLVYQRLAPGVCDALRGLTPRNEKGQLKHKLHQHLTVEEGRVALARHLHAVIALMKGSNNWRTFNRLIERSFPKFGETMALPIDLDEK